MKASEQINRKRKSLKPNELPSADIKKARKKAIKLESSMGTSANTETANAITFTVKSVFVLFIIDTSLILNSIPLHILQVPLYYI